MERLDNLDILAEFVDFLNSYSLIDAYIKNSRNYKYTDIRFDLLIFSAFIWINTPEGYRWAKLDREWEEICKEKMTINFKEVIEALEKGRDWMWED